MSWKPPATASKSMRRHRRRVAQLETRMALSLRGRAGVRAKSLPLENPNSPLSLRERAGVRVEVPPPSQPEIENQGVNPMAEGKNRKLVVVQLSGGNDYLNCIVPVHQPGVQRQPPQRPASARKT